MNFLDVFDVKYYTDEEHVKQYQRLPALNTTEAFNISVFKCVNFIKLPTYLRVNFIKLPTYLRVLTFVLT